MKFDVTCNSQNAATIPSARHLKHLASECGRAIVSYVIFLHAVTHTLISVPGSMPGIVVRALMCYPHRPKSISGDIIVHCCRKLP